MKQAKREGREIHRCHQFLHYLPIHTNIHAFASLIHLEGEYCQAETIFLTFDVLCARWQTRGEGRDYQSRRVVSVSKGCLTLVVIILTIITL